MSRETVKTTKKEASFSLYSQYGALLLLLLTCMLLVTACGANANTTASANKPKPTEKAKINLGNDKASPTPKQAEISCGIWVTNATPAFDAGKNIAINAIFNENAGGNPKPIPNANVSFTVQWGDFQIEPIAAVTGIDGRTTAFAQMAPHANAIDKLSLITAKFQAPDGKTCEVEPKRAASFVILKPGTKQPDKDKDKTPTSNQTPQAGMPPGTGGSPTVEATKASNGNN